MLKALIMANTFDQVESSPPDPTKAIKEERDQLKEQVVQLQNALAAALNERRYSMV